MSSPIEIGQEVLSAQGEILGKCVKRYGFCVMYALVAVIFLAFATISFHAVLWVFFLDFCALEPFGSALCVLGVDLLFVFIFVLLAVRSRLPSVAEERARLQRDQKWQELKRSLVLSTVMNVIFGSTGRYAGKRVFNVLGTFFKSRNKK